MAISGILPVQNSVVSPGDSFTFTIDSTYTALVIKVAQSAGDEYAYDYALGGVQAGYTVAITDNGATHDIEVSRDSGWNKEPTTVSVTENETGSSVTTSFSYYLTATAVYPEGMQPYSDQYDGTLIVTEENVTVRNDVGWIDYDTAGFVVTDMGPGKVRIELDPAISGSDEDAIHDNVVGEINAIAAKGTPTGSDVVIIEDAAASYAKKKVLISNLPTGGGGDGDFGMVKLGTWNFYLQTEADWPNTTGTAEIDDDPTLYGNLRLYKNNSAGPDMTTLLSWYTGGTVILVDASGNKAYWEADGGWFYYSNLTTNTWTLYVDFLYKDAGFTVTGGGQEYTVYFANAGIQTVYNRKLANQNDLGTMTMGDGNSPIYNDFTNEVEPRKAVHQSAVDPTTDDDLETGNWEGRLWVSTTSGNLWVCTDNFTGEWLQIVQNVTQYDVGNYTYDNTAGTPNADGEAEPNHATYASVTSINFYQNDADAVNIKAQLLSLQAGSTIDVYDFESQILAWTVTGSVTDNGTYVTVPVTAESWSPGAWPQTPEGGHRFLTGAGAVQVTGDSNQNAALFIERTSEVNASAATLGELWVQAALGAGDQTLKFTNESGTRFALIPHIDTVAPGAGDDVDDGHEVGQIWIDTVLDDAHICLNNSAAAAVWKVIAT